MACYSAWSGNVYWWLGTRLVYRLLMHLRYNSLIHMSMVLCKTVVSPLLTYWRYYNLTGGKHYQKITIPVFKVMWGKIIIPMYRLWLNGLYELYGPRCPLFSKRPINLISLSLSLSLSLKLFFNILQFHVTFLIFFFIAIVSPYLLLVGLLLQYVALFQSGNWLSN